MNGDFASKRENLLRIKRLYKDLLLLALRQQQIMESADAQVWPMQSILELQNQRQAIMQRIDELDCAGELMKLSSWTGANTGGEDQTEPGNEKEILAQIRKTMLAIQTVELNCQQQMEKAQQIMRKKIAQTRDNKKAHLAYNQSGSYSSAWFFDKKR